MSSKNPKKPHKNSNASTIPISLPTTPHFVSVAGAATILAVSQKTIRRAIADGRLKASRLGRRVLISQGALQHFMTALIVASVASPTPCRKP